MSCRSPNARTVFVNQCAPATVREALRHCGWEKSSFDVKALIGKTQVVWVYDATCKLSGENVALKCYRKELQSPINYQYALTAPHTSLTSPVMACATFTHALNGSNDACSSSEEFIPCDVRSKRCTVIMRAMACALCAAATLAFVSTGR